MALVILQLNATMLTNTKTSMENSIRIEHATPWLETTTDSPKLMLKINHGKGNLEIRSPWYESRALRNSIPTHPTVTSKMLEPTDEDTAISPLPCLATRTLVIRSGTEVPAAKNVKPITYILGQKDC